MYSRVLVNTLEGRYASYLVSTQHSCRYIVRSLRIGMLVVGPWLLACVSAAVAEDAVGIPSTVRIDGAGRRLVQAGGEGVWPELRRDRLIVHQGGGGQRALQDCAHLAPPRPYGVRRRGCGD